MQEEVNQVISQEWQGSVLHAPTRIKMRVCTLVCLLQQHVGSPVCPSNILTNGCHWKQDPYGRWRLF